MSTISQLLLWVHVCLTGAALHNAARGEVAPAASGQEAERSAAQASGPAMVREIQQLISQWRPANHLYIRGSVGLSPTELVELESWLASHGPHWTVLLFGDADGQRYVNADGRVAAGMDAVELALGDLMELGSFRELRSANGEGDGAVLVLYLRERKFSYRASQAQDRRDLGASRWVGQLDRPAFRAMRGGGRIVDAVRDTVSSINQQLQEALGREQQFAAQQEQSRRQAIGDAKAALEHARQQLANTDALAAGVRAELPAADGDLAQPKLDERRQKWDLLAARLESDPADPAAIASDASQIANALEDRANAYAEFAKFENSWAQLDQRRQTLQAAAGPFRDAAAQSLQTAQAELRRARELRDQARADFQLSLNAAGHALDQAQAAMSQAQATAEREAERRQVVRRTTLVFGGVAAMALASVLAWLNRRRQPARIRALEQLQQRRQQVRGELEGVMQLIQRAETVVGDRDALKRKGYQGQTLAVSLSALQDVDDLLVMSNSVERVVEQAMSLIQPRSPWGWLVNLCSAARYNEGFELLDREPIRFSENEGISLVREDQEMPATAKAAANETGAANATGATVPSDIAQPGAAEAAEAIGSRPDASGMTLSFAQLFALFRGRAQRAHQSLTTVEDAWSRIVSSTAQLQANIDDASQWERKARAAAEHDGLLAAPALFDELLKYAQADQDLAEVTAAHDPVQAMAGPLQTGTRQAQDAKRLAELLVTARQETLPGVDRGTLALRERHCKTQWIGDGLASFASRADELAKAGARRSIAADADAWWESLRAFEQAIGGAVELHDRAEQAIRPAIESARRETESARHRIASVLGLPDANVLRESQLAPSEILAEADGELQAAGNCLDRGDLAGAELALDAADQDAQRGLRCVGQSLRALDELPGKQEAAANRLRQEQAKSREHEQILQGLHSQFAADALLLRAADAAYPDAEATAAACVQRAASHQQGAQRDLATSNDAYRAGRLIEAQRLQEQTVARLTQSQEQYDALRGHADRLRSQSQANEATLQAMLGRWRSVAEQVNDRRTMRATLALNQKTQRRLEQARVMLNSAGQRNPFEENLHLAEIQQDLEGLAQMVASDRQFYDEAARSLAVAPSLMSRTDALSDEAARDQIPDSAETRQEIQAAGRFAAQHQQLQARLQSPHEDWLDIDRQADQLAADITQSAARLQGQLQAAQAGADAIRQAADEVHRAAMWSGSMGVRAATNAGQWTLERARECLNRGDYQGALEASRQSQSEARNAVQAAEMEVARLQRQQQRALEEQRRAAANMAAAAAAAAAVSSRPTFSAPTSISPPPSSSSGAGGFSRSGW